MIPVETNGVIKKGRGGLRPNSGRKPQAITKLRVEITERIDDAEYAFGLFRDTMRDTSEKLELRLQCAEEVMNRVLGKPRQQVDQRNLGTTSIRVQFVRHQGELAGPGSIQDGATELGLAAQRRATWEALRGSGSE